MPLLFANRPAPHRRNKNRIVQFPGKLANPRRNATALRFAPCALRFALCALRFAPCALRPIRSYSNAHRRQSGRQSERQCLPPLRIAHCALRLALCAWRFALRAYHASYPWIRTRPGHHCRPAAAFPLRLAPCALRLALCALRLAFSCRIGRWHGLGDSRQYGHETGAMIAGLLVGLVLVLLFRPAGACLPAARAVALCAAAIGFGGAMTYGQTVA